MSVTKVLFISSQDDFRMIFCFETHLGPEVLFPVFMKMSISALRIKKTARNSMYQANQATPAQAIAKTTITGVIFIFTIEREEISGSSAPQEPKAASEKKQNKKPRIPIASTLPCCRERTFYCTNFKSLCCTKPVSLANHAPKLTRWPTISQTMRNSNLSPTKRAAVLAMRIPVPPG